MKYKKGSILVYRFPGNEAFVVICDGFYRYNEYRCHTPNGSLHTVIQEKYLSEN